MVFEAFKNVEEANGVLQDPVWPAISFEIQGVKADERLEVGIESLIRQTGC